MTKARSRPTPLDAPKFAAIAAECARVCGVDVRLTPLAAVPVQVGPAPPAPDAATDAATPPREVACIGVRFDDEYVIVRLPSGGFRAFKVDPAGRVVLRLGVRGGFRAHVSRVFGALIWDRLKRGRSRYEPQLELLPVEEVVPLVAEAADLADPGPGPASREVGASPPRPKTKAKRSPSLSPAPEPPPPSGSAAPPGPPARVPAPPVAPSPPPSGPMAPSSDPAAPLARRLRGPRAK